MMKKEMTSMLRVCSLSIVLLLCAQPVSGHDWTGAAKRLLDASYQLVVKTTNGTRGCTAWLLSDEDDYVVTAAHCLNLAIALTVDGRHATPKKVNAEVDLAVLYVRGISGMPLVFRSMDLMPGLPIATVGYPFAGKGTAPVFRAGWIAPRFTQAGPFFSGLILDLQLQQGHSGGAIVDRDGAVVSLFLQYMLDMSMQPLPLSMGAETRQLWDFVEEFLPE